MCKNLEMLIKNIDIFSQNFKTRYDLIEFDLITILLDDPFFETVLNLA